MSRKLIALLCAVVLAAAAMTACGMNPLNGISIPDPNNVASTANDAVSSVAEAASSAAEVVSSAADTASTPAAPAGDAQASANSKVSDGIKVETINYKDDYSNTLYLLMTNDSAKDCDLDINVDFFMGGKIVGTTSGSVDAVAKGTTVCEDFYCDEEFDSFEYKVVASDIGYYVPVDQNLALDVSQLTNKVIVSLTNNGKIPAKYVWYDVFFYKNGQLVSHNYSYCEDSDSEIKVGATERSECSFYGDDGFDDVRVYFHGEGYADD